MSPSLLGKEENELWLLNQGSKIEGVLFSLLILLLPTQFARHFWPSFSYIMGLRIDYLSPALYATDLLIGGLCILQLFRFVAKKSTIKIFKDKYFFLFIVISVLLSTINADNKPVAWYGYIKLLECIFFGWYVKNVPIKKSIWMLFLVTVLYESCIAVAQYISSGSLNGMFYFLGERFFTSQTPGIATASLNGTLVVRPYATFSHPNVLAGYLLVILILLGSQTMRNTSKSIKENIGFLFAFGIGSIAIILTMSRVTIFAWLGISVFFLFPDILAKYKTKDTFKNYFFYLVIVLGIGLFLFSPFSSRFFENVFFSESFLERKSLITYSITMIATHPVFGVGLLNFIPHLARMYVHPKTLFYLQPVHNIYLLTLSEIGTVGFFLFTCFLLNTFGRVKRALHDTKIKYLGLALATILFIGFFDHYFLTLQQGQLLFSFVLGLCYNKSYAQKKQRESGYL